MNNIIDFVVVFWFFMLFSGVQLTFKGTECFDFKAILYLPTEVGQPSIEGQCVSAE